MLGDDGSHPLWQHVRKLTMLDFARPTPFITTPPSTEEGLRKTPEYNLDLLLARALEAVPAAQMKHVVLQMGGASRYTAYPQTARALFGLTMLRTLSLSTFNPQKLNLFSMKTMPRTLIDVIVYDCHNFDIEGLLANQLHLQSVTVEGDAWMGVLVTKTVATTWNTVRTLCIDVPVSETHFQWMRALLAALVSYFLY